MTDAEIRSFAARQLGAKGGVIGGAATRVLNGQPQGHGNHLTYGRSEKKRDARLKAAQQKAEAATTAGRVAGSKKSKTGETTTSFDSPATNPPTTRSVVLPPPAVNAMVDPPAVQPAAIGPPGVAVDLDATQPEMEMDGAVDIPVVDPDATLSEAPDQPGDAVNPPAQPVDPPAQPPVVAGIPQPENHGGNALQPQVDESDGIVVGSKRPRVP